MAERLAQYAARFEELAGSLGLDYDPVDFELVPPAFMLEVSIYGLPVRMPHWSFGVRYIYQLVQTRMGNSQIFEVVFPGDPNRAYLADTNSLAENSLVTAHVLGHADFAKHNALFQRSRQEAGAHIVEQAATRARRIERAIVEFGQGSVERVLDCALALEQHIDVNQAIGRAPYPVYVPEGPQRAADAFSSRFRDLPGEPAASVKPVAGRRAPVPARPENDLLWFIAQYAPELEDWEREIFLAVREESFYFYPLFACQIMNEGWAAYWHARLLREATFLPESVYVDAIKSHSDVVSPFAGERRLALQANPYHLGFSIWERIIEEQGVEGARKIRDQEDDFGFVRNYLDARLAETLQLFVYEAERRGRIEIVSKDIESLHERLLAPKFNYGAPRVSVSEMKTDGTLVLTHAHRTDGRGLDFDRAVKVLDYIHRVWRRPVILHTVDFQGASRVLKAGADRSD
ncbi:MAG: SpoVR family protein [Betaproteobacteria bacterium]|nr:SpoVR family protein [Betaproteobacteria bacterium]